MGFLTTRSKVRLAIEDEHAGSLRVAMSVSDAKLL